MPTLRRLNIEKQSFYPLRGFYHSDINHYPIYRDSRFHGFIAFRRYPVKKTQHQRL